MTTLKNSLKRAVEIGLERDRNINLNQKIESFVTDAFTHTPSSYGHLLCKKIIYDSNGVLLRCEPDFGDAVSFSDNTELIRRLLNYEVKTSYLDLKTNTFRLTHLRDYQDFDYFIVCFIDRSDNFKPHFYVLTRSFICDNKELFKLHAMNNTNRANQDNVNIDKAITIKKEVAFNLFGKNNLLPGTSYDDLITAIKNYELHDLFNKNKKMKTTKIAFDVNGTIIKGKTNEKLIVEFVNYLGPLTAQEYFPSFYLSTQPTKCRYVRLRLGNHFFDPKISPIDIKRIVNRGNKKTGLNIKLM